MALWPAPKRILIVERRPPKAGGCPLLYEFTVRNVFDGDLKCDEVRIRWRKVEFVFLHAISAEGDYCADAIVK
jgi:hypothetical protein